MGNSRQAPRTERPSASACCRIEEGGSADSGRSAWFRVDSTSPYLSVLVTGGGAQVMTSEG